MTTFEKFIGGAVAVVVAILALALVADWTRSSRPASHDHGAPPACRDRDCPADDPYRPDYRRCPRCPRNNGDTGAALPTGVLK